MSKFHTHSSVNQDWDKQDILFAVRKKGTDLFKLARANGYTNSRGLHVVFYRTSAPKAQRIIADFLDLTPETIWPSRYTQKRVA